MLIRGLKNAPIRNTPAPARRSAGFVIYTAGRKPSPSAPPPSSTKSRDYLVNGYRCHGAQPGAGHVPPRRHGRTVRQGHRLLQGQGRLHAPLRGPGRQHGRPRHRRRPDPPRRRNGLHAMVQGKTGGVTFTFMGDGAINQGTFNESLNLASLYKLPCIFVVENNGVAMGTQVERSSAEQGPGQARPRPTPCRTGTWTATMWTPSSANSPKPSIAPAPARAQLHRRQHLPLPRPLHVRCPMKYRTKEEARRARLRDPDRPLSFASSRKGILIDDRRPDRANHGPRGSRRRGNRR
jgi:hypothetical protein